MRIVQVNLASDPGLDDPHALLDAYHTLTGWSEAVAAAGAAVRVVQRFGIDATVTRRGISYAFVQDGPAGMAPPWAVPARVVRAVADVSPEVIHVNGLMFPGILRELRRAIPKCCIVVQDHSGAMPRKTIWPFTAARRARWRSAFRCASACTFTARALAKRWRGAGLPDDMTVFEIPEASTALSPVPRDEARRRSGLRGSPSVLWVGRLDRNKDPLTVLTALERVLPDLPGASVTLIVPADTSRRGVEQRIAASAALRDRVCVFGPVAYREMTTYYSAADVFVSGSHHEGSGYALIEAMACGVVPCVTDIPAFRALTGGCGALWQPGDASDCAASLRSIVEHLSEDMKQATRRRFEQALSWEAIGRQTVAQYSSLLQSTRAAV